MEENVQNQKPFNEAAYRNVFAGAGIEYPEKEIEAKLRDPKALDLHNRAKAEIERQKYIDKTKDKYRGQILDARLRRAYFYFLKDETNSPENEEFNRHFIEQINTPEGAQAFIDRLTSMFMKQDVLDFIPTNLEDMTEKYLQDTVKYNLYFVCADLYNGPKSAGGHPLYTVDPEVEKVVKEKIVSLQGGEFFFNAVSYMALDSWAIADNPVMDSSEFAKLLDPMQVEMVKYYGKDEKLTSEMGEMMNQAGLFADYEKMPAWEKMREMGIMKDGQTYTLNGQELGRKDIERLKPEEVAQVKSAPMSNWASVQAKLNSYPQTNEEMFMENFLAQMEASQKKIWGNGSPEFRNLMEAVRDYRKTSGEMGYYGRYNWELQEKMANIGTLADAYLKTKEGKSLNTNGKLRFDMVTQLRSIAGSYTKSYAMPSAGLKKYEDMLEFHSKMKDVGIQLPTAQELKRTMEDPEMMKLHENAKKMARDGYLDPDGTAFTQVYHQSKIPHVHNNFDRIVTFFVDTSGTPEAEAHNKELAELMGTKEGRQKVLNTAVKTIMEVPDEFFLPKNTKEAAERYINYPEVCQLAWVLLHALEVTGGPNDELKLENPAREALAQKKAFFQLTANFRQNAMGMAREDWGIMTLPGVDQTKAAMYSAIRTADRKEMDSLSKDPYYAVPPRERRANMQATTTLIGMTTDVALYPVGNEFLSQKSKLLDSCSTITVNGKNLNISEALEHAAQNKEQGKSLTDGLEIHYDAEKSAALKKQLAEMDVIKTHFRIPGAQQPQAEMKAEAVKEPVKEPEKEPVKEQPQAEAKAEHQPEPEVKAAQPKKGALTEQETEKFAADREAMQKRCDSLPEGPEKLVAQMAIMAKERIYQHEISQHVYTKMPLDMKVMVFDKLMQLDAANGGTMARAMTEHNITDINAAAKFIDKQNMGKAMKNFMQDVSPYEAGNGKMRFPVGAKLQRKAFAVGDGATEMARQCTESIQRESKAAAEQKFNEALKQKQMENKAPEHQQGGLGMGK